MSIDKIKKIVSYDNKKLEGSIVNMPYIEFISSDDEEFIRKVKSQNRDLLVDIVLGEKNESEWNNRSNDYFGTSGEMDSIIAPKVMSIQSQVLDLKSYDEIYSDIIDLINTNTKNSKKTKSSLNLNLALTHDSNKSNYENYETDIRKIITRINMCSSILATGGRIGPANFILVGEDNWDYFYEIESMINNNNNQSISGSIMGMQIIYEDNIDTDKVILGRKNKIDQPGIHLIEDLENCKYTIPKTFKWIEQLVWFNISKV
jgi:hypothetical protein